MIDQFGRNIKTLRLSVTDNCNMKCMYCNPDGNLCEIDETGNLSADDILKTVRAMVKIGIHRIRITGGEPTVRPDLIDIIARISALEGVEDLSMTTNGIRLSALAHQLKIAGLQRLNISLDSLDPIKFASITGGARLQDVLDGIDAAISAGLAPIKTNTVLIRGINDDEIDGLIALAKDKPVDVRFIELMPIGKYGESKQNDILTSDEVIAKRPWLKRIERAEQGAPAIYYSIDGYQGKIGFISPISHEFCGDCNRIRVSADGMIRPCLGHNGETDIKPYFTLSEEEFEAQIARIIFHKPRGHHFENTFNSKRNMNRIGG
jgi:cyclic pyranopterin phosphate synthase